MKNIPDNVPSAILMGLGGRLLQELGLTNVDDLPDKETLYMFLGMCVAYTGVAEDKDFKIMQHIANLVNRCNNLCKWVEDDQESLAERLAKNVSRN